ncbi:MAG TPA: hypothetical protein VMG38_12215 [Trebonia sp.]|nr:hypothetical protein [Trebonia sp.]
MLTGAFQGFLLAIAGSTGALTGALFVALSVSPRSQVAGYPLVIRDVRAAAALLSFSAVLSVSLFGLVPGANVGTPAIITGVIGLLFTAAGVRSIVASPQTTQGHIVRQVSLVGLLVAAFSCDVAVGTQLFLFPRSTGGARLLCDVQLTLVLVGIARSWELVGNRETGLLASIAVLTGRSPPDVPDAADSPGAEPGSSLRGRAGRHVLRPAAVEVHQR